MASPAVPGGAPSGRASVKAMSALALEQNHLSPQSRHEPVGVPARDGGGRAHVGAAGLLRHPLRALAERRQVGGGESLQIARPELLAAVVAEHARPESVIFTGQRSPNSDWAKR